MKFSFNKISITFILLLSLITLFFYSSNDKCDPNNESCVCQEKVKLEFSLTNNGMSLEPVRYVHCIKETK